MDYTFSTRESSDRGDNIRSNQRRPITVEPNGYNHQSSEGGVGSTIPHFDGDGKADLAVANRGSNNVSVLLGNGHGTFSMPVSYAAGSGPSPLRWSTSMGTASPISWWLTPSATT